MAEHPAGPRCEELIRLMRMVFCGVRRPRLLAELLGWETRTLQRAWDLARALDLMAGDTHLQLSPAGLRVCLSGARLRRRAYARAVARSGLVQSILADPDPGALRRVLRRRWPGTDAHIAERAAALRVLIEPALDLADEAHRNRPQLSLALPAPADPSPPSPLDLRCGTGENPDTYALALRAVRGCGELGALQLRAVLDQRDGAEVELAPLIDMGVRRGELARLDERLVAVAVSPARAAWADDGSLIALSDPEYRRWLDLARDAARPEALRLRHAVGRRFLHWDARLWGDSLLDDPRRADGISLPPFAAGPATLPVETQGSWLQHLDTPGLPLAFPRHLVLLGRGLSAILPLLRPSGQGPRRPPNPVDLPARVHGGLFSPGERPLRVIADGKSLRLRALQRCPAISLLAAVLMLHRRAGGLARVRLDPAGPMLCVGSAPVGPLMDVLVQFCADQGWAPSTGGEFSIDSAALVRVAIGGGYAVRVGRVLCLDEGLATTLSEDDEGRLVQEALDPLLDRVWTWLAAVDARPVRRPLHGDATDV